MLYLKLHQGLQQLVATIINSVDDLPKTYVLWRGLMHWIGGMGIIVLILSFLKNLGADAAHMFNAEASVPKPGVVMPRIQSMASKLWRLYVAFYRHLFRYAMGWWYRAF